MMFSSTVNLQAFWAALMPYVITALGAVIVGLGGFAVAALRKYTGIIVQQASVDKFDKQATMWAGKWVSQAAVDWATQSVDVHNPFVAGAANDVIAHFADDAATLGITQDKVKDMILGKIGALQAQALSTTPVGASNSEPKTPAGPAHQV